MSLYKTDVVQSRRLPALLLAAVWVVSACSGSGNPTSTDSASNDSPVVSDDAPNEPEPVIDNTNDGTVNVPNNNPTTNSPVVTDPLVQNSTAVTFEITVPAYQSNELRIELTWGETNLVAMWVGDEYWSATGELPTETEHELIVTFYDNNGGIELARFSQNYKTGSNESESFQISAQQFDANLFDDDGDGTNNLSELIAGTDPLVNEYSLLEIRDFVDFPTGILSTTQALEIRIGEQRPYTEISSEFIPVSDDEDSVGTTLTVNIEIDAAGNGTASDSIRAPWYSQGLSGTRTATENSVQWQGGYGTYDGDYRRSRTFSSEVIYIDETKRGFKQQMEEEYSGTYKDTWQVSSDLSGTLMQGTDRCIPEHGTISRTHGSNRNRNAFNTYSVTATKGPNDQYWKVLYITRDDEKVEYLARELKLNYEDSAGRDYPTFLCDLVDFK